MQCRQACYKLCFCRFKISLQIWFSLFMGQWFCSYCCGKQHPNCSSVVDNLCAHEGSCLSLISCQLSCFKRCWKHPFPTLDTKIASQLIFLGDISSLTAWIMILKNSVFDWIFCLHKTDFLGFSQKGRPLNKSAKLLKLYFQN